MTTIGFIGLGNMGGPMAANLAKAGHRVQGFDLSEAALDKAKAAGIEPAGDLAAAVLGAGVVITMLPAGPHVQEAYAGEGGILAHVSPGTLLIDSSTIDVETARLVASAAGAKGLDMLDAPVSGGVGGAAAGTLTFMVGGEAAAFEKAKPLFDVMGKTIVHTGGAGNGQAAKMCNNMMLGIQMLSVCEAMTLADSLGLDRQKLFDVSSTASGQCWALTSYCPVPGPVPASPANNDYKPGFTAEMMLKDLRLSQGAAQNFGVATPLGAAASALFGLYCNAGNGHMDFSGIIRMIRGER